MRWMRFTFLIIAATLLQAEMLDVIAIGSTKINLLLIMLVFFAIYCGTTEAIITSFVIGFAADLIGSSMGPAMLSFGIFGTLLAYLCRVITINQKSYQGATIFLVGILAGHLTFFLAFIRGQSAEINIWRMVWGASAYSALIGPFLFLPLSWCMNIKKQK